MALEKDYSVMPIADTLRPILPLQDRLNQRSRYVADTVAGLFNSAEPKVASWAGTMGGNKTEALANVVDNLQERGEPFIIFKLKGDERNGTGAHQIFRRQGPAIAGNFIQPVECIQEAVELSGQYLNGHGAVLLNEGQFMGTPEELSEAVDEFVGRGYSVGGDFLGAWYDGTPVASTQAVINKSTIYFPMQGWDSVSPDKLADFTMRGVAVSKSGEVLHAEDTFYRNMTKKQRIELVECFGNSQFAKAFEINNPDGTEYTGEAILLPSHFDAPNFAIGADRYIPLSNTNFELVYTMAGIKIDNMPPAYPQLYRGANVFQWHQIGL